MKITWFGKSVFRIYVGGRIVVIDPQLAPSHVALEELRAGTDQTLILDDLSTLTAFNPTSWQKSRPARLVDETDSKQDALTSWRLSVEGVLIDTPIEETITIVSNPLGEVTLPSVDGVWLLWGEAEGIERAVDNILTSQRPSVIALAITDVTDQQMGELARIAMGRTILILEPELALEV